MKQYLLTIIAGGVVISVAVLSLEYATPRVLSTLYNLMTTHPNVTIIWGLFAVLGIDHDLVALRDGMSFSNVGAKAKAHLFGRKE